MSIIVPSWLDLNSFSKAIREEICWDGRHSRLFYQGRTLHWDGWQNEDEPKRK